MGARMHSVDTETRHGAGSYLRSLENRIRERAYEFWTAHGCIHGQADQHWLAAEREILTESTATLAGVQQKRRFLRPTTRRAGQVAAWPSRLRLASDCAIASVIAAMRGYYIIAPGTDRCIRKSNIARRQTASASRTPRLARERQLFEPPTGLLTSNTI